MHEQGDEHDVGSLSSRRGLSFGILGRMVGREGVAIAVVISIVVGPSIDGTEEHFPDVTAVVGFCVDNVSDGGKVLGIFFFLRVG
jgi:hypothetical protein